MSFLKRIVLVGTVPYQEDPIESNVKTRIILKLRHYYWHLHEKQVYKFPTI